MHHKKWGEPHLQVIYGPTIEARSSTAVALYKELRITDSLQNVIVSKCEANMNQVACDLTPGVMVFRRQASLYVSGSGELVVYLQNFINRDAVEVQRR